jgi:hypothetical protein
MEKEIFYEKNKKLYWKVKFKEIEKNDVYQICIDWKVRSCFIIIINDDYTLRGKKKKLVEIYQSIEEKEELKNLKEKIEKIDIEIKEYEKQKFEQDLKITLNGIIKFLKNENFKKEDIIFFVCNDQKHRNEDSPHLHFKIFVKNDFYKNFIKNKELCLNMELFNKFYNDYSDKLYEYIIKKNEYPLYFSVNDLLNLKDKLFNNERIRYKLKFD